ncbi:MAG: Alkaline phosphatase, partial [Conexibacter sp.]|nr:Alkaline phosphatase [Conexibacter sp.]
MDGRSQACHGPEARAFGVAAAVACVLAFAVPASARAADPVLAAAGDIACAPGSAVTPVDCHQQATSNLIIAAAPSAVATVGDNQYESGLLTEFTGAGAFDATWGRLTPLLHPAPGNHEYTISPTADGYFRYFGGLAGPSTGGYYSYDVGAWHVVSLNSNCSDTGCSDLLHGAVSTAEVRWLQSDLDAHAGRCTLAYWHHPRFTSGPIGDSPGVGALWDQLYAHRADVTLAGHDHDYERFAPMNPAGAADAQGIREFVVGTGGQNHGGAATNFHPYSQVFDNTDFAVLMLTLHPASYDWALERDDGTVLDQGSGQCHAQPPIVTTGAASQVTTSSAAVAGTVDPNALSTSYQFGYGTTTAYGASSPTVSAGSGKGPVAASASLGGLSPATTYHYRLVAGNTAGTSYGPDQTFTTDAEPPAVTPPPAPPPIPPPAPPP